MLFLFIGLLNIIPKVARLVPLPSLQNSWPWFDTAALATTWLVDMILLDFRPLHLPHLPFQQPVWVVNGFGLFKSLENIIYFAISLRIVLRWLLDARVSKEKRLETETSIQVNLASDFL